MARQLKTPQQRAQESLDVASRIVDRIAVQRDKTRLKLQVLEQELLEAVTRRDFLAKHPDLAAKGEPDE